MKKIFMLLLVLFLTPAAFAQKEYGLKFSSLINDDLTLENAIRLGLENNTDFLAARQEITIAEQKVAEAKFMYFPQISLQGTATWFNLDYPMVLPEAVGNRFLISDDLLKLTEDDIKNQFYGVGVTATQYLYSGGRISSTLKMAKANLKQAQSKYDTVKNAVVLNIKKAFFNLLYAQEHTKLTEKTAQQAQNFYQDLRLSPWEKVQARAELAALLVARNAAVKELKDAELAMLVALNKELNSHVKVVGSFKPAKVELDLPHLNLWSMEFRPELKSAIYALELDNLAIDLALSRRYPDIILSGSYEQLGYDNLDSVNRQISVAVRLPLSYNLATQSAQKKAEQTKSTLRRSAIEDKIHVQVASAHANMMFWQAEVLQRQETFTDISKLFTQAQKTPKQGVVPLQALGSYLQAGSDYYTAIRNNLTAKAELEWAIGRDL